MSLITDPTLKKLWEVAQAKGSDEWASVALWNHLLSKYIFWEKTWVVSAESPPGDTGRRRVDITIKWLGDNDHFAVLKFHEIKSLNATPKDLEEVEHQALNACMAYLYSEENKGLEFVYALTSFGTKGRAWRYFRDDDYLSPLFGSMDLAAPNEYVELHSSEAHLLKDAFSGMKVARPSA